MKCLNLSVIAALCLASLSAADCSASDPVIIASGKEQTLQNSRRRLSGPMAPSTLSMGLAIRFSIVSLPMEESLLGRQCRHFVFPICRSECVVVLEL